MTRKARSIRNMLDKVGSALRPSRSARRGFTLLELLIAVGALAIISVGVAVIFEATARTVQTGRRISAMASYASLIERRMREDFATMSRDGYLIIKNMYATKTGSDFPVGSPPDPNDAVPLSDTDQNPRLRRTDEIMFFIKGQYVSARELLDGRFVPKADAAAIYYGHGEKARAPLNFNASGSYATPSVNNDNRDQYARLGFDDPGNPPPAGTVNPNRYASDWVLVRHLTLLRPPQTSQVQLPVPLPLQLGQAQVPDSDVQVSLQPAASNLFRSLSVIFPTGVTLPAGGVRSGFDTTGGGWLHPFRASGLVDIATTDLPEIKAIITTADSGPVAVAGQWAGADNRFFNRTQNLGPDGSNRGVDGKSRLASFPPPAPPVPNSDAFLIDRMHSWMDDGLPALSDGPATQRTRIRCESSPNNYVGVLSVVPPPPPAEESSRRADQLMLSASNFLPHCTEFIVEWSFGTQYTSDANDPGGLYVPEKAGQLVWYGMPRSVNGDMVANTYGVPVQTLTPLPSNFPYPWDVPEPQFFRRVDPNLNSPMASHNLDYRLVHGTALVQNQAPGTPITSFFGYHDPTFNPDLSNPSGTATPDGLLTSPGDAREPTIPWAWPRFIRITMSLADPNNPSVEQSFQFVFDVPAAQ